MKKIYILASTIILLSLFIIFGLPFLMNFWVVSKYPALIQRLANTNPNFSILLINCKHQWFSSSAQLKIILKSTWLKSPAEPQEEESFLVDQEITPGPIILSTSTHLNHPKIIFAKALVQSRSENKNISFNASSIWHFNNTLSTSFSADNLNLSNHEHQLNLQDFKGRIIYNLDKETAQAELTVGNGAINDKSQSLTGETNTDTVLFNDLEISGDFENHRSLWYGARNIKIRSVVLSLNNKKMTDAYNISITADHLRHQKTSDISLDYYIGKLNTHDVNVGPINMQLSVNDLDNEALDAFFKTLNQVQNTANSADMNNVNSLMQLLEPTNNLISKGFTVKLSRFTINSPHGDIETRASISLTPQQPKSNPLETLQNIQGTGTIVIPNEWLTLLLTNYFNKPQTNLGSTKMTSPAEMAKLHIDQWIKNKMLTVKDDRLQAEITFKRGQLLINGLLPNFGMPTQPGEQP